MLYQLVLGREPESAEAVAAMLAFPDDHLPIILFSSQEARDRIEGLRHGQDPWRGAGIPGREFAEWVSRRLPLSPTGRECTALAGWSWPALFLAFASDPLFVESNGSAALADPEIVETLAQRARSRGMIEGVTDDIVVGWALPRASTGDALLTPALVELWIDGAFAGASLADRFRRDIQDQIGGDGNVGFIFDLASRRRPGGDALIEVRRADDGVTIGFQRVSLAPPRADAVAAVRAEIAELRSMLERLERSLPNAFDTSGGASLSEWSDYFDAWYADVEASRPDSGRWAVLIDAAEAEPAYVQASLAAMVDQARAGDRLLLIAAPGQLAMAEDLVRKARLLGPAEAEVVKTAATDPADRVRTALARARGRAFTLLVRAGDVPSPWALAMLTRRFQDRLATKAIYFDEDRLDSAGPREGPGVRHIDPMLKPGPDPDLLLQTPYVGRTLAFRTPALDRSTLTPGLAGLHGPDLLLRLLDSPAAVEHLPVVMVTRTAPEPDHQDQAKAWGSSVAARLASRGEVAEVTEHKDILGAVQRGSLSILRSPPSGARATVIIPTRDRLDLLIPCVESLSANRSSNATSMEILIVDHESCEPATSEYLKTLSQRGVRVLRHEGPFNWALMNNVAAANVEADVLVFLNNDTVVLSPDWLDALVSQALRQDVGCVGCRLVYGDGTLQHAGCVARGHHPGFVVHEGVGVAGSDGGYLGRHALTHASSMVTGACIATSKEVFRSLGGFDAANFPVEGNDADFCFRARASGLRVLYEPRATLYHLESKSRGFSSSGEKRKVAEAADRLLRERWGKQFGNDPFFNHHFDRRGQPFQRLGAPFFCARER